MDFAPRGAAGEELNAFIGRERELGELRLLVPLARALTLSGTGGIGKTRLAVHLLAELAADFPDGAWFVELADLRQPDLVASRIAATIGVIEEPGRPLLATLADALRPRRLLIGLDNCEHLIDACARVCQRLLASSPGLQVITTSREPLRVAAEQVWQVPPLSIPATAGAGEEDLLESDALRLFADRAAMAQPGFRLTPGNVSAVAAICRQLDGLPLAIELAAAWVRALSVEQIAARLADRFRLLSSAERAGPARHRTLRAAIDWSHDLLAEPERVLLRRLSVFASWPLEMAEQVCADGQLSPEHVLDLLTALSDKSLVISEPKAAGQTRYRMLDTIREYALDKLAQAGEADQVHARFLDYGVREVEKLALTGMAQVPAAWSARVDIFRRYEADTANVRQLLGRCLTDGDAHTGLRICAAARPVWIVQGSFAEGSRWIDSFLALRTAGLPDIVLGRALISRAQLALATDPAEAGKHAEAGLELCRAAGEEFWAASALNLLAEAALHAGDAEQAAASAREAMAIARQAGDRFNEGYAYGTLGALAAFAGDLDQARGLGEAALAIAKEIDQLWGAARAYLGLGDLARLIEDLDIARQHYLDALEILRQVNARPQVAKCLAGLGRIAMSQDDLPLAGRYLRESLELSQSTGSRIGVIRGLESIAALATATGDLERAVRLAAAAAALREDAGLPGPSGTKARRFLDAAAILGDQAATSLWEAGTELDSDAAVELALAVRNEPRPLSRAATAPGRADGHAAALTSRELQIAELIAKGYTNKAIAAELVIAQPTVAKHVANILAKLDLRSRVHVAAWALEHAAATGRGTGR